MASGLGGEPAQCTITGYYRTSIYEYPGSYVVDSVGHHEVYSSRGLTAAIVSGLPAYFEQSPRRSRHYSIDVSLRTGVHSTYREAVELARKSKPPRVPLFVVIGEFERVRPTVLDNGECFAIDEFRDGSPMIEGGREGHRTLLSFKTSNGSWPDLRANEHAVNVVLTAVKAEQNVTDHIKRLYGCSCFVNSGGTVVYFTTPTMRASLQVQGLLQPADIPEKAGRIASMLQAMMTDSEPTAPELFDSLVLEESKDDGYFRLWYLRLWQALEDAKRHLGYPQLDNFHKVIAGTRAPKDLKEYRHRIAHWYTGRIDFSYLRDLQHTALELLRRKYSSASDPESDGST